MRTQTSRTSRRLLAIGSVLVVAIVVAAGWLISSQRAADLDASQQAQSSLAQILAEQTSRTMQPVDMTLREMLGRFSLTVGQPADSRDGWESRSTFNLLVERLKGLPQVDALSLVGADGRVANFSRDFPPPALDAKARDYYRYLSTVDDHGIFVSAPFQSYLDATWSIVLARRINGPSGGFAGIVAAVVSLAHLEDFYRAVTPADGGVTLLRRDGTILVHTPSLHREIGLKLPPEAPWYQMLTDAGGSYRSPGYIGIAPRMVAVRPLRDFPLVVNASLAEKAALSAWRQRARWLCGGAAIAIVCVVFLLRALGKQFARLEQSEASLARQNAELETGHLQFDAVLDNVSQGVSFFDENQKLIVCNRRYADIYRLSPEEAHPGTTLAEIIEHRHNRGTLVKMSPSAYLARRAELTAPLLPFDVVDELSDGRTVTLHYQPLPNGGWVTTHEDVTERRRIEASLAFMARHDALTTLPNRTLFQERLEHAIAAAKGGTLCALFCLDLDRFKVINDTLGHPVGDGLLRAVAQRLSHAVREIDTVARLGGDEFAIVQFGLNSPENAGMLADRIMTALQQPYEIDGNRFLVGASIGIAVAPNDGVSSEALLKNADIALYLAKAEGRGTYRFFAAAMDAHVQRLRLVEMDLRNALPSKDFQLCYQPIVDIRSGRVTGVEALIRWHHPIRGLVSPADFIPIAEETGLIVPIGEWLLRTACVAAAAWPAGIDVAVNLSPAQFRDSQLLETVRHALAVSGLAPGRLVFEITESVLMQHSDDRLALLHQFRALGIRIALDDFGTGYSSLSYLRSFPFDKIKIDRSFVRDVDTNQDSVVIVSAIIGLAHNLGITIVAEGVENITQLAVLRSQGCFEVQGYLFSPPVPAAEVPMLIQTLGVIDPPEFALLLDDVPPLRLRERFVSLG